MAEVYLQCGTTLNIEEDPGCGPVEVAAPETDTVMEACDVSR